MNLGIEEIAEWFKGLFQRDKEEVTDDLIEEAVKQDVIQITTNEQGREVVEILNTVKLDRLVEEFDLKLPPKDLSFADPNQDLPEDIPSGKILDVPFIPQSLYKKNGEWNGNYTFKDGGTPVPHLGYTMCSAASATMLAAYYGYIPYDIEDVVVVDGQEINLDLREYVWKDKGLGLNSFCDVKSQHSPESYNDRTGEYVDGTFAVTADYRYMSQSSLYYLNQQCNEGQGKHAYDTYFEKIGLTKTERVNSFTEIKEFIDSDKPVMFSEQGHLMTAVGYLNIPDSWNDTVTVRLRNGESIDAKKEFFLIAHDPKRNRNRVSQVENKNKYFSVDGGNVTYLIVSKTKSNGEKSEYMCRASNKDNYECTLLAGAYSL